jgi:hypothetical protein
MQRSTTQLPVPPMVSGRPHAVAEDYSPRFVTHVSCRLLPQAGSTALHKAARRGHRWVVQELLLHRCDAGLRNQV